MSEFRRMLMMSGKQVVANYLTFEDKRVWEVVCYKFGDTQLTTGEIASGDIECDGNSLVYSDYIFACCSYHPARTRSDGSQQSNIAAAAQTFGVSISVDNTSIFDGFTDEDIVISVMQYSLPTATYPTAMDSATLLSVTKEDWSIGAIGGNFETTFTTTNGCQYLRVGVKGASDGLVNWSISAITGNRQPIGITEAQCAAQTSLQSYFNCNNLITKFNELEYFKKVKSLTGKDFNRCTNLEEVYLNNITTILGGSSSGNAYSTFFGTKLPYVCLPNIVKVENYIAVGTNKLFILGENLSSVLQYSFRQSSRYKNANFIIYATTPPTSTNTSFSYNSLDGYIYVPDEAYDTYLANSLWNTIRAKLKKISELPNSLKIF